MSAASTDIILICVSSDHLVSIAGLTPMSTRCDGGKRVVSIYVSNVRFKKSQKVKPHPATSNISSVWKRKLHTAFPFVKRSNSLSALYCMYMNKIGGYGKFQVCQDINSLIIESNLRLCAQWALRSYILVLAYFSSDIQLLIKTWKKRRRMKRTCRPEYARIAGI